MSAAHEWELWSTTARLVVLDEAVLADAVEIAHAYLARVDRAASRFRADSEIRNLQADGSGSVALSPLLTELLDEALAVARRTDGAVDPTVGAAMSRLGYDRDFRRLGRLQVVTDGPRPMALVRSVPGWQTLELRGNRLTAPPGIQLDLGASAKALAADRVAERIARELHTGVLVSLGGDIATAGDAPDGGWQVRVQDTDDDPVSHVAVPAGTAVATSSTVRRTWSHHGHALHHIVDPASSLPAPTTWRSVTVAAPSCSIANAATTATVVKGSGGREWLRRQGLPARLVTHDGSVVLLNAWPAEAAA